MEVREIRLGEVRTALVFAQAVAPELNTAGLVPMLSLTLCDDQGRVLAAALSIRDRHGDYGLHLLVDADAGVAPDDARTLLDKATLKARTFGLAKCHLRAHGEAAEALWQRPDWLHGTDQLDAA